MSVRSEDGLFFCLFQRQMDDCVVNDTARPFMVASLALCLDRYGIVVLFIVANSRPGAIFHITSPVVARASFGGVACGVPLIEGQFHGKPYHGSYHHVYKYTPTARH
jgi:hypothetical protein